MSIAAASHVKRVVRDKVNAYHDECELWKLDHDQAMLYFDFRDFLCEGLALYRDICRLDENWRSDVYQSKIEYDADFEESVSNLFRRFAKLAFRIETELLPWYEQRFGDVDKADEFRACCNEMRGTITNDGDFFMSDELVKLRDEALDEAG